MWNLIVPLIPALVERGEAAHTVEDCYTLAMIAVPLLKDSAKFEHEDAVIDELTVLAANGKLTACVEALRRLALTFVGLLADPRYAPQALAVLKALGK